MDRFWRKNRRPNHINSTEGKKLIEQESIPVGCVPAVFCGSRRRDRICGGWGGIPLPHRIPYLPLQIPYPPPCRRQNDTHLWNIKPSRNFVGGRLQRAYVNGHPSVKVGCHTFNKTTCILAKLFIQAKLYEQRCLCHENGLKRDLVVNVVHNFVHNVYFKAFCPILTTLWMTLTIKFNTILQYFEWRCRAFLLWRTKIEQLCHKSNSLLVRAEAITHLGNENSSRGCLLRLRGSLLLGLRKIMNGSMIVQVKDD